MRVSAKKVLDPPSKVPYFILTELQEDTDNFEESQINVSTTDGVHFWRKEGQRRLPQPDRWMTNVYNAISDPKAEGFEFEFSQEHGDLKLTIRWRHPGIAGKAKADIHLQSCEGPEPMRSLLDTLFSTLTALQESHDAHARSAAAFKDEAFENSKLVEEYVKSKEAREEELYAKFSAVLNAKKEKLRELKQRIEDLERKLRDEEDGSDAGSQGRRGGGVDEYNSIYDAETEPSDAEVNEAETLPAMQDTLGQQTLRHTAATLLPAETTSGPGPVTADQAAMLEEPTQPQEAPDVVMEQATNGVNEAVPVSGPSVAAARKPTTIARRRQR
ncbi:hypothetical protein COCOBI_09-2310 [Coccomyxa sp. Obi]|nr:hypothetical protein COCOBI_09-2310 [Coccomyxa sp. Obi]